MKAKMCYCPDGEIRKVVIGDNGRAKMFYRGREVIGQIKKSGLFVPEGKGAELFAADMRFRAIIDGCSVGAVVVWNKNRTVATIRVDFSAVDRAIVEFDNWMQRIGRDISGVGRLFRWQLIGFNEVSGVTLKAEFEIWKL